MWSQGCPLQWRGSILIDFITLIVLLSASAFIYGRGNLNLASNLMLWSSLCTHSLSTNLLQDIMNLINSWGHWAVVFPCAGWSAKLFYWKYYSLFTSLQVKSWLFPFSYKISVILTTVVFTNLSYMIIMYLRGFCLSCTYLYCCV